MRGFIRGACVVLFGGCAWFYLGGMHGLIRGACMVLFGGACMVLFRGACMVLFGGHAWFYLGACVRGFFSFFGYNEIRSMSGWYASYWNAFLFFLFLYSPILSMNLHQIIRFEIYWYNKKATLFCLSCIHPSPVFLSAVKLATDERCTDNKLEKDVQNEEPEKEQHVVKPEVVESATLTGQYLCR